jgi:ribosomal protein L6P/L9E
MQAKKTWWDFNICMLKSKYKLISKILLPKVEKNFIFLKIKNKRIIILYINSILKKYYLVPRYINILKKNACLNLESNIDCREKLLNHYRFLNNIRVYKKLYSKTLILKGLGFKILQYKIPGEITLKLGYSHIVSIMYPSNKIYIDILKKNKIIIKGNLKFFVGNISYIIKNSKTPNAYKMKGFYSTEDNLKLKEIKK